jgi:uracil-DNA glycosylase
MSGIDTAPTDCARAAEAAFGRLVAEIRGCTLCRPYLQLGPRPVLRGRPTAGVLIVSQAPGARVHESGLSFDDKSGDRLRAWLGLDRDRFYDEALVAVLGMGFCYPGRDAKGGDLPPRPECAPRWHPALLALLPEVRLTLLVGGHAIRYYAGGASMTAAVIRWREFLPAVIPLPHPSWRTVRWERDNPWFADELLPELRARVAGLVSRPPRDAPCPRR